MPFRVFETTQEVADELLNDNVVSRQTVTVKDGGAWDIDGKVVLVDGAEDALDRAEEIVVENDGSVSDKADDIKADIDAEEDSAAAGLGSIFG